MSKLNQQSIEERLDCFFDTLKEELVLVECRDDKIAFARDRLVGRMRKRAAYRRKHLRGEAFAKFISVNESIPLKGVTLPEIAINNAREFITHVLERYFSTLSPANIQVNLDAHELLNHWRFGPGASYGVEGTHIAEKILQPLTCTSLCEPFVVKLQQSSPYFQLLVEHTRNTGRVLVNGSRLSTVPKNEEVERTTAKEPSGNMCLQLAAGAILENALRGVGLDITTQEPKNKELAYVGSITGGFATIDLSSASDMISIDLVRALMPAPWFQLLMALRSPEVEIGKATIKLNMISTMGNGFTFPLMTLILLSLIYANRCSQGGPRLFIDWKTTCVYGDDIIVPEHEFHSLCELIGQAGLVVNYDKSFNDGYFRESCGGDYYKGYDVTPFYVKTLADNSHVYIAINQVLEWGAQHGILLHRTLLLLKSFVSGKPFLVPEWQSPDSGILTSQCPRSYRYLKPRVKSYRLRSDHPFAVALAAGGYVNEHDGHAFYTPRPMANAIIEMRVARARLPQGFLDGSSPVRSRTCTDFVGAYTFLMV